jgi:hypothetical protein
MEKCNQCGNQTPGYIIGGYICSCGNMKVTNTRDFVHVEDKE